LFVPVSELQAASNESAPISKSAHATIERSGFMTPGHEQQPDHARDSGTADVAAVDSSEI